MLVGVDACTNVSLAEDGRDQENEFWHENHLSKVTNRLPNLRDATLGKTFWGYHALEIEIELAGIKCNLGASTPTRNH